MPAQIVWCVLFGTACFCSAKIRVSPLTSLYEQQIKWNRKGWRHAEGSSPGCGWLITIRKRPSIRRVWAEWIVLIWGLLPWRCKVGWIQTSQITGVVSWSRLWLLMTFKSNTVETRLELKLLVNKRLDSQVYQVALYIYLSIYIVHSALIIYIYIM